MIKKEARLEAESIFLAADGKISNVEIAKRVGVNALTIGKWKKADTWMTKLTGMREQKTSRRARKKDAYDQALNLFLQAEGRITDKALAGSVGVSKNSIATWRRAEQWAQKLERYKREEPADVAPLSEPVATPAEPLPAEEPVSVSQIPAMEETTEIEIDVDQLACPEQINRMNKRIEEALDQGHLSLADLKILAETKEAVLRVVGAYLDLVERCSEE